MRTSGILASIVIVAVAAASFGRPVAGRIAQDPAPRFRTGVELVEVAVLARGRDQKPVTDLTRDDITVLEDGVPQAVVAFERIVLPSRSAAPKMQAAQVAQDVASNESLHPSRIFVLVLDSNHVAATRVRVVRARAREFVENHVAPEDYVAVFSPGALASATQDFTTDKARVIAAIDQFTGMKMASAVVEIDRERQAAEGIRGAIPMHDGHDPSDGERTARARGLTGTLEVLAAHLERIPGRRKSLLLFSEGIDYDTTDVMGTVQRNASDVTRAMSRAIGALMRTNVALYAIDPRALNVADADLLETPIYAPPGSAGFGGRTVADEQRDSIRILHSLSDSTGGFAAVDRNEFAGAFERIVDESSSYYVIGYTPERPARPGEVRSISVKTSRPNVTLSARKGYVGKPAEERRTSSHAVTPEPSGFSIPGSRGRGRGPDPVSMPDAPAATPGLSASLQALLASPLPQPGLPIRVQAVTLRGDGRKTDVRLVVEVLGRSLQFAEKDGRFTERVQLALLTVNDGGRASNGTSIDIDLRLTPDDLSRVKATGVRWLSALDLPPGHHQLRVAGRAAVTGTSGMITHDIVVPEGRRSGFDMSGVTITSVPSVLMITKGKPWLDRALTTPPTAARTFVAGDRLVAALEIYRASSLAAGAVVNARVERLDGSVAGTDDRAVKASGPRSEQIGFPIDTGKVSAGRYVLRISLDAPGSERLQRAVPFEVVQK